MEEEKISKAKEVLDELGAKHQSFNGLSKEETAYFDILLWLFADGEEPIDFEDI